MIELFIDGQKVNTKKDISLTLVKENPLLTKNGFYTYDINVSLEDPNNLRMYLQESRINGNGKHVNRTAELVDEKGVLCRGTEVVLEKNDTDVKIQIVSDNSEFNYLISHLSNVAENKIRELNFGWANCNAGIATITAYQTYPQTNFVLPPFYAKKDDKYTIFNPIANHHNCLVYSGDSLIPQPFLLYYIDKLIALLGYKVKRNCLSSEEKWRRLLVIHGYDTWEFSKMLPDWTVVQFIEEVEKFFNVVFLVDSLRKEVSIENVRSWRKNQPIVHIAHDKVIDEFNKKFEDEDSNLYRDYNNVKYCLPSSHYWKLQDIDPTILKKTWIEDRKFIDLGQIPNWNDMAIYRDPETVVMFKMQYKTYTNGYAWEKFEVQSFQRYIKNAGSNSFELKIIPAEIHCEMTYAGEYGVQQGWHCCPVTEYSEITENTGFQESIDNGPGGSSPVDYMQVAFYAGVKGLLIPLSVGRGYWREDATPMCFVKEYIVGGNYGVFTINDGGFQSWNANMTLQFSGPNGRIATDLNNDVVIMGHELHVIKFLSKEILDPSRLFTIKNRLYLCKQLKYTITDDRVDDIVEGEFYPVTK